MNRLLLTRAMLGLAPLLLGASEPSTQPSPVDPRPEVLLPIGPGDGLPGSFTPPQAGQSFDGKNHRGDRAARLAQRFTPPSDKDKTDALQFMQIHSPQRLKAMQSLPDGDAKARFENIFAHAYVNWMRLANTDTELYAVVQKRIELEDQIFGKVSQVHKEPADAQDALRAELKGLVGKLVDNGIQERQLRLQRLEKTVADERKKLEADAADRPTVVDQRYNAILNNNSSELVPNSGPVILGAPPRGHGGRP